MRSTNTLCSTAPIPRFMHLGLHMRRMASCDIDVYSCFRSSISVYSLMTVVLLDRIGRPGSIVCDSPAGAPSCTDIVLYNCLAPGSNACQYECMSDLRMIFSRYSSRG